MVIFYFIFRSALSESLLTFGFVSFWNIEFYFSKRSFSSLILSNDSSSSLIFFSFIQILCFKSNQTLSMSSCACFLILNMSFLDFYAKFYRDLFILLSFFSRTCFSVVSFEIYPRISVIAQFNSSYLIFALSIVSFNLCLSFATASQSF